MKMNSHRVRETHSLNGLWDFAFLGPIDSETFQPADQVYPEKALVPSAFDALPPHEGKRGVAVYRTDFAVPSGKQPLLAFEAVSLWCRVYVNGVLQAENRCGYAPFTVAAEANDQNRCEVVVLVDNRFDFERVPMHEAYFDFYQYGGIIRKAQVHFLPIGQSCLTSIQVTPDPEGYREGCVHVAIRLNPAPSNTSVRFSLAFDGGEEQTFETCDAEASLSLQLTNPQLWSPEHPRLHQLRVVLHDALGNEIDDLAVRFGLRHIEARHGALFLNGEKLILRGYNRHEWHPNFGPCTPVGQMMQDLLLLKELGGNFIRGSHYQQSQEFLDLCDEMGVLVWEESLGWGQRNRRTFESARWHDDHRRAIRSMVEASFNHPSVIIWGFLNEAASSEQFTRRTYEETVDLLRQLDPSRLVSYATNVCEIDLHYDLVDLISINIYPGWYGCEEASDPLSLIASEIERYLAFLDDAGWKDKPILVSEIGAEGLYGWREAHNDFFSETYQARYLERAAEAILSHPRPCGVALWMFSDVRTYGGGRSLIRPRTFNNKGTFDEYRRPKAAFDAVRKVFCSHRGNALNEKTA